MHMPPVQVCPAAQALPQAPQLSRSVAVVTHAPAQAVWPDGHCIEAMHMPPVQVLPAGQVLPQVPQFGNDVLLDSQPFARPPLQSSQPASQLE